MLITPKIELRKSAFLYKVYRRLIVYNFTSVESSPQNIKFDGNPYYFPEIIKRTDRLISTYSNFTLNIYATTVVAPTITAKSKK
jgi:hypothetical protein